jgi:PAS domain S-box-containing protein
MPYDFLLPLRTRSAKLDFAVMAVLTFFLSAIFFVSGGYERFPVPWIIPYALLWVALCFGIYMYRRWLEEHSQAVNNNGEFFTRDGRKIEGATTYTGIGNWEWNIDEDTLVWSDEVYKIFDVTKENFQPSYPEFLRMLHPEDRLNVEEAVAICLRENTGYAIDHRIVTPSGEVRIVYQQGGVLFLDDKPVKMTGTVTDVTEQKLEEINLKDRFTILQSLIDAIPIPVYHKDENAVYEGCNKAFERFFDVRKEEIIGKIVYDFLPHDLASYQDDMDKRLFRQGGIQTYEKTTLSRSGQEYNVIYHTAALTRRDGSLGGLIGTILDITDRKRMEMALKDSEQRLRTIAQSASDWFWETDEDHRFSFLSSNIEDTFGVTGDAILGKTRIELVGKDQVGEDSEKWARHLIDLNEHQPFKDLVYVLAAADGSKKYIRINGIPVFDQEGNFKGYQGTGSDITKHRQVEEALRASEERHRDFAADVAHELRTPLAVLRTQLDNLTDSTEVMTLRQDVDNMSRMVSQLLTATRIETFTLEDSLGVVDLREICTNVATLIAPLAIKEHRSIEVTGGENPVHVKGDSGHMEQAVRNLVENAIRYSARGTIITLNVTDDDEVPTLKVIDRGRGIAMDLRENIFKRFKRSDRRSGGAGLGLSIVKRAVERHNAEIEIEDTPEGGATFVIRFPEIESVSD